MPTTTDKHILEINSTRTLLKGTQLGLGGTELKPGQSSIAENSSVYRMSFRDKSGGTTGAYHECPSIDLTAGVDSDTRVLIFNSDAEITSSAHLTFEGSTKLLKVGSGSDYGTLQRNASDVTLYSTDTLKLNGVTQSTFLSPINAFGDHTGYSFLSIKQPTDNYLGGISLIQSGSNDTWSISQDTSESLIFGYASNASGANQNSDFTSLVKIDKYGTVSGNSSGGGFVVGAHNETQSWALTQSSDYLIFKRYDTSSYVNKAYMSTSAFIVTSGIDIYSFGDNYQDYSSSSTVVGWGTLPLKEVHYKKIGNTVIVWFTFDGVSNDTAVTFTVPYRCYGPGTSTYWQSCPVAGYDNGASTFARAYIVTTQSTVYVKKDWNSSWTNTGNKRVAGILVYETDNL